MAEGMGCACWALLAWWSTEVEEPRSQQAPPRRPFGNGDGPYLARRFAWNEDHIAGSCQTSGVSLTSRARLTLKTRCCLRSMQTVGWRSGHHTYVLKIDE